MVRPLMLPDARRFKRNGRVLVGDHPCYVEVQAVAGEPAANGRSARDQLIRTWLARRAPT